MARVCPRTRVLPEQCWCPHHCQELVERARRKVVRDALWEWKGGDALHVYVSSKVDPGSRVSLCNLRQAISAEAERADRSRRSFAEPTARCLQCQRTLGSHSPNARMRRYLLEHGVHLPEA